MDSSSYRFFQDSGFSRDTLALPPGLEDFKASPLPLYAGGGFGIVPNDVQSQPGSTGVEVRKFCVHCGMKVADKLLKMKNVKFCVHCGKQHPENFMDVANSPIKVEDVNEEVADFISLKQKVETLKSVDMITQLLAMCDAQLTPSTTQDPYGQQQVHWSEVFGEQSQSASCWGQQDDSTYAYTGYELWDTDPYSSIHYG